MLYILFIVTAIFVFCAGVFRTGNRFNPLTFYIGFWGLWTIVSLNNPFTLNDVTSRTYLIVWVHVIITSVGFLLINQGNIQKRVIIKEISAYEFLLSKKFLILQLFTLLVLAYFYRKYNLLLSSMSILDSRRIVYEQGLLFGSSVSTIFYSWIITPIVKVSILLLLSNLILNGRKNVSLWISMVNCILFSFIGGGRFVFFEIIFFVLIAFGFKYDMFKKITVNFKKVKRINKLFYATVILFGVYFMNLNTAKRLGISSPSLRESIDIFTNTSIKQMALYFIGPFRTLDYFLTAKIAEVTGHTLGRSFFSGVEEIFNTFLIFFSRNGMSLHTANEVSSSFTVQSIVIGNNITFNAFYSAIMNFYLDGGILLVILLSALLGIVMALAYKYYLANTNILTFSLLVFMTYQLVATEFRWNYSAPGTCIAIGVLVFLHRRHAKKSLIAEEDSLQTPNPFLSFNGRKQF